MCNNGREVYEKADRSLDLMDEIEQMVAGERTRGDVLLVKRNLQSIKRRATEAADFEVADG